MSCDPRGTGSRVPLGQHMFSVRRSMIRGGQQQRAMQTFGTTMTWHLHNIVSPRFGDNDGDGAVDLVLMGTGYAYTAEEQPGVAVFTSLTPGTDIDVSDADLYFYSEVYSYKTGMIVSDLYMTGDGVAELICGRQQYAYGVIGGLSIIDAAGMTAGRYEITESQLSEYTPNASNAVVGVGLAGGIGTRMGMTTLSCGKRWLRWDIAVAGMMCCMA